MAEVPSYWRGGVGYAPRFSRSVARASQAVTEAEESLVEALKKAYPHGEAVYVIHHRGSFSGHVVGWDRRGARVVVKNARTGKEAKWWAAHVQLTRYTADGTDGVQATGGAHA